MVPPQQQRQTFTSTVVPLPGGGRILALADIRGDIKELNRLVEETNASAVIMTGDFGLFEPASLERIADKTLKHLITYSPTIAHPLRSKLLASPRGQLLSMLAPQDGSFPLSQFPQLLNGKLKLKVPTFAVYGACEDVRVVEKFRTGEYHVDNLTILDEATTRVLEVGGVRLRLLGLGGALVMAKLFDNGEGSATIAGGGGTMWTTALQIGELIDTAQRVHDPSETRLLITHSSIGREPILGLLSLALKADLTISAGLHFRYGASFNEFSVQDEGGMSWWAKIARGRARFNDIYEMVEQQVLAVIDSEQKVFLDKALAVIRRMPPAPATPGAGYPEEPAWKNVWSWNLTDSTFGHLLLIIKGGKVASELKSQGFNFSSRAAPPTATASTSGPTPSSSNAQQNQSSPANSTNPSKLQANSNNASNRSSPANQNQSQNQNQNQPPSGAKGRNVSQANNAPAPSPAAASGSGLPSAPAVPSAPPSVSGASSNHERTSTASPISPSTNVFGGQGKPTRNPHTLFVNQLVTPVTEAEIKEFFGAGAAGITRIKLSFDHSSGHQKRFAYVEFSDADALQLAVASQAKEMKGGPAPKVAVSDPPSSGDFGGPGGGGFRGMRGGRGGRGGNRGGEFGGRGRGGRGGSIGRAAGAGGAGAGEGGNGNASGGGESKGAAASASAPAPAPAPGGGEKKA